MPDIVLIQPPIRDFYLTAKRTIPYGLACIAAVLKHAGFSVDIIDGLATSKSRIIDLPLEMAYLKSYYGKPDISPFALFHHFKHFGYSFEYIGKKVKESGAFLVGISSLFTAYSDMPAKTARTVKRFHPECKIVLGGHHPTFMPEKVMECEAVDFVIRGEGEVSMPMLAEIVKGADSLKPDSVPGIVFRKCDGTLHISEPAFMDNPDLYPLPATELVKHSFYKRNKRGSSVVVASRGCPMKCSYCALGSSVYRYTRRSVDSVISEIGNAVNQYDAGFIDFEDENLSLDREWFLKLLFEIKRQFGGLGLELRAMNGLFPPTLDEQIIKMMKQAGFRTLNLSLGSTSEEQLRRFNRPDPRKALENIFFLAQKYGLEAVCYIIAGAPGQKPEDSVSDILYLAQKKAIAGVSVFYPAPGSADFELSERSGILPPHFSLMRSSALPISHTTTRVESVTILRLGRILNFMKSLLDNGLPIPDPLPYIYRCSIEISDRRETGIQLLQWFLHDGKIRGVTPDGTVYEHNISTELTHKFIKGVRNRKHEVHE
ncbi:MAG: B12-binding domain-containing radical SAM protein [Desulfobacterales bacterium]|nr:B12-binding domain-containing radical SAM protein [Desulfobacterales bacterium]